MNIPYGSTGPRQSLIEWAEQFRPNECRGCGAVSPEFTLTRKGWRCNYCYTVKSFPSSPPYKE